MTNSKKKGDKFERDIAKQLGDWWGNKFSRTPQSGGAHWLKDNNAVGDIVTPPHAQFPFVIECKSREGWTIENVLLNNQEPHTWWAQVINDSESIGKVPCLVFKRKFSKIFVTLPYKEQVYNDLRDNDYPVMRSDIIIQNIRQDSLYFDTMTTTIDGLVNFSKSYIKSHYAKFETKPYRIENSALTEQNNDLESTIDDMLSNV